MSFFNPDMMDMLDVFQTESLELMDRMEAYLMSEEKQSQLSPESLQGIFRIVHTMKSSSAMMGLESMSSCTHRLEDLFLIYRETPEKMEGNGGTVFDLLYDYVDYVRDEMKRIPDEDYQPASTEILLRQIHRELDWAQTKENGSPDTDRPESGDGTERRETQNSPDFGKRECGDTADTGNTENGTLEKETLENPAGAATGNAAALSECDSMADGAAERSVHGGRTGGAAEQSVHGGRTGGAAEQSVHGGRTGGAAERSVHGGRAGGMAEPPEHGDRTDGATEWSEHGGRTGEMAEPSEHGDRTDGTTVWKSGTTDSQEKAYQWRILLQDGCQMENVRAFLILKQIRHFCGQLFSTPENLQDKESAAEIQKNGLLICFTTNESEQVYQKIASSVYVKAIEDLSNSLASEKDRQITPDAKAKKDTSEEGTQPASKMGMVAWKKILLLQNVTGELITVTNMLEKELGITHSHGKVEELLQNNRHLLKELEELINSVSMTPVSSMVHQYNRAIRDICKKEEKDISFQVQGAELEVDRTLIDSLSSPLLHLIRNAADHGIEPKEERIRAGKPGTGKILFSVFNVGENLFLSVSDDGRGLNKEQILDKAETSGLLLRPREAYTEEEIYQFIFRSGFSTSREVTEFSGRGVGLDVVQKVVDRLHGSVYVESQPGQGTNITVSVPVTLTSIDSIQFSMDGHICFVPTKNVEQIYNYGQCRERIREIDGLEYFQEEEMIPLIRLRKAYGYTRLDPERLKAAFILVVNGIRHKMAIVVDQIDGQYTIVEKTLPELIPRQYKRMIGMNGCAITAEGGIGFILNIDWIMRAYERGELYEQTTAGDAGA